MDERVLNELLECSVCLDTLDHSSKVLPCQHTFCRRCLEEIVTSKQELRCPECRLLVEIKVDDLPANILLVRLLEGLKTSAVKTSVHSPRNAAPVATTSSVNAQATTVSSGTRKPCARALYTYNAKESGDLSFKKGDMILLLRQVDENWLQGQLGSSVGFFPASYVQVVHPLPPQDVPKCKALYDFEITDHGDNKDCLFFKKDAVINVLRRVDDNWIEGKLGEQIGIFPLTFVEMNDAAKWLITHTVSTTRKPSSGGDLLHTAISQCLSLLTATSCSSSVSLPSSPSAAAKTAPAVPWDAKQSQQHRRSLELETVANGQTKINTSTLPLAGAASRPQQNLPSVYIALYHYKPQKPDELELIKGKYYTVAERCQDGWFKGTCLSTSATGVFPGNYVQQVKLSPSKNGAKTTQTQPSSSSSPDTNQKTSKPKSCQSRTDSTKKESLSSSAQPDKTTSTGTSSHSHHRRSHSAKESHKKSSQHRKSKKHVHRSHSQRNSALDAVIPAPTPAAGAEGGTPVLDASEKAKERKDKATSNQLIKRLGTSVLTKTRKARTPPPADSSSSFHFNAITALSSCATIRTDSSVPSDSESDSEKSKAIRPVKGHRKASSLDSAQVLADLVTSENSRESRGNCDPGQPPEVVLKRERYRCVVPYPSQSDLELDLNFGDLIFVHKKREDGWFKGTLQRTGKTGLFPSSFVESY